MTWLLLAPGAVSMSVSVCNTVLKRKARGHALLGCILSPEANAQVELEGSVMAVMSSTPGSCHCAHPSWSALFECGSIIQHADHLKERSSLNDLNINLYI